MGGFNQLPMQANPTQDPDPNAGMAALQSLMSAFRGGAGTTGGPSQNQQMSQMQTADAQNLAMQVAARHAQQASGGDPEKFKTIFNQLYQQYSTGGARIGSSIGEAVAAAVQAAQGAQGLYGLGKGAVNLAGKTGIGQTAGQLGKRFINETSGDFTPEQMMEFFKNMKDVPPEWRAALEKKLAFQLLKGKDPFAGKPVPLGPPSGSNAATGAAPSAWPQQLAQSTKPVPTTGATAGTQAGQSVPKLAPEVTKALGGAAPKAAADVFFDAAAPLSAKESAAIIGGIRQAIPRLYEAPAKSQQLLARLDNVEKYVASLGEKATKIDLLSELRKQGMLTKSAYEVLKKMGYTGIKEKWAASPGEGIKRFSEIMNPAFDKSSLLK